MWANATYEELMSSIDLEQTPDPNLVLKGSAIVVETHSNSITANLMHFHFNK